MVRVGGGWVALDEFLVKNDPCRGMSFIFQSIQKRISSSFEYNFHNLKINRFMKFMKKKSKETKHEYTQN